MAVREVSGSALFFLSHKTANNKAITNNKKCKRKGIKYPTCLIFPFATAMFIYVKFNQLNINKNKIEAVYKNL